MVRSGRTGGTAIIRLLLDTGRRRSELANLMLDDVDLQDQVLRVVGKSNRLRLLPFRSRTGHYALPVSAGQAHVRVVLVAVAGACKRERFTLLGVSRCCSVEARPPASPTCTRTSSVTLQHLPGFPTTGARRSSCGSWARGRPTCCVAMLHRRLTRERTMRTDDWHWATDSDPDVQCS